MKVHVILWIQIIKYNRRILHEIFSQFILSEKYTIKIKYTYKLICRIFPKALEDCEQNIFHSVEEMKRLGKCITSHVFLSFLPIVIEIWKRNNVP